MQLFILNRLVFAFTVSSSKDSSSEYYKCFQETIICGFVVTSPNIDPVVTLNVTMFVCFLLFSVLHKPFFVWSIEMR